MQNTDIKPALPIKPSLRQRTSQLSESFRAPDHFPPPSTFKILNGKKYEVSSSSIRDNNPSTINRVIELQKDILPSSTAAVNQTNISPVTRADSPIELQFEAEAELSIKAPSEYIRSQTKLQHKKRAPTPPQKIRNRNDGCTNSIEDKKFNMEKSNTQPILRDDQKATPCSPPSGSTMKSEQPPALVRVSQQFCDTYEVVSSGTVVNEIKRPPIPPPKYTYRNIPAHISSSPKPMVNLEEVSNVRNSNRMSEDEIMLARVRKEEQDEEHLNTIPIRLPDNEPPMTKGPNPRLYNKPILAVKPTKQAILEHSNIRQQISTSNVAPELTFIMKDLVQSELNYIAQLEKALEISCKLREDHVAQVSCYKFFGLLNEVYSFHKEKFAKELLSKGEKPKDFILCFVRQHLKFNIYIQRQWVIPSESDLDDLEYYLLKSHALEDYINLTTRRVSEYDKFLQLLKYVCEKTHNAECEVATASAIKIISKVQNQIDKVNFFKEAFKDSKNEIKECGRVLLENTFKVSRNGGTSLDCSVYFCENLIIFAQNKGGCQYLDNISTSQAYCRVSKTKHKFEIGLRGRQRFKLTAESQDIKQEWCNKFREVLKPELFEET